MMCHFEDEKGLAHFYFLNWIPASMNTSLDNLLDNERVCGRERSYPQAAATTSIIRSRVQIFPSDTAH